MAAAALIRMAVNDYVVLHAYQNTGGAFNTSYVAIYAPSFMMRRIGN